jgi:hypothetical protein
MTEAVRVLHGTTAVTFYHRQASNIVPPPSSYCTAAAGIPYDGGGDTVTAAVLP